MVEYIPCYSAPTVHWGFLPATRLASRILLIEPNIKKRTGPALCVLCGITDSRVSVNTHSVQKTVLLKIALECGILESLKFIHEKQTKRETALYVEIHHL
jgi:hypothetical protein